MGQRRNRKESKTLSQNKKQMETQCIKSNKMLQKHSDRKFIAINVHIKKLERLKQTKNRTKKIYKLNMPLEIVFLKGCPLLNFFVDI